MVRRVVALDMDETIGEFGYLGRQWGNRPVNVASFPEFCKFVAGRMECFRPGIIAFLSALCHARTRSLIDGIVMYTNNSGPPSWPTAIAGSIHYLTGQKVFDNIITGYRPAKVGCRTGHAKTYADLCRCLNVPTNILACFVDDQYHPGMIHPNVTYLRVPPYHAHKRTRNETRISNSLYRHLFFFLQQKSERDPW